jgi:hypothetical protein
VILGPRTRADFITASLGMEHARMARLGLKTPAPRVQPNPPPIQVRSAANAMVAMIASSEANAFGGAVTAKWWPVLPQDGDDQIILETPDGDPLVFERPVGTSGGRMVVWCTSADGNWNNWTVMPNFVPLVNETIRHLAASQTQARGNGAVAAGAPISWSGPGSLAVQSIDVVLPDGTVDRGKRPSYRNGRYEFEYANTFIPGLYALRFDPPAVPQPVHYGVGLDARELETAVVSEKEMSWFSDNGYISLIPSGEIAATLSGDASEAELWKWLTGALILLLILETFVTYRLIGRRGAGPSPQALGAV